MPLGGTPPDIIQHANATLRRMLYFRRQYDQRRAFFYRQYIGQRDQKLFPDNLTPRSNTFVPYPHSNVETVVSRTLDAFFSLDPPIETRPRSGANTDTVAADKMQKVLLHALHRADWTEAIEILVRNIAIYGHAGLKVDWDWDFDTITGPEPIYAQAPVEGPDGQPQIGPDGQPVMQLVRNPQTGQPIQTGVRVVTKQVPRNCPKFIPVDIYDLLVDPDGGQVAHMVDKTWAQMQREAEANPHLYFPDGMAELGQKLLQKSKGDPGAVLVRLAELWDETHNTITVLTFGEDKEAISWKDLRYSYRNATYSTWRREMYQGQPILLYHGPNPFAHKRAPILYTSYTKLPNEIYGIGVIEKISDLTEGLNKFVNMITDNWNLGINRRYAYNTEADIDHDELEKVNVPGGKVGVTGNPTDVLAPLPFMAPSAGDYQVIELYKTMVELVSGVSDFYAKGIGTPRGNRTSSGISQVISEGNYLFRMFIRNLEEDILQPLLEMCATMVQQFGSDELETLTTGEPPAIPKYGRIKLEEIIGSYEFDFVGVNYATDKVIRQRNMMAFYNIAMRSPYANQPEFLREIAKVLGISNYNRLLKPEPMVQQEAAANQRKQLQLALMEKLFETESQGLVAELRNSKEAGPAHALEVQEAIESFLAGQEELLSPIEPATSEAEPKEGRPAKHMLEGKLPGATLEGVLREEGQQAGANALGLEGLGGQR